MATIETKPQLIERLHHERAAWEALLAEIGKERMLQPGAMGDWTMKDVVAHVTGWGKQHIARLQAAQNGTTPEFPINDEENGDVDVINQGIYDANKDHSLDEVLNDSRAFWQQFEDLIGALPERDLMEEGRYSWMKGRALGLASLEDTASHIHEEHEPNIRQWLAGLEA